VKRAHGAVIFLASEHLTGEQVRALAGQASLLVKRYDIRAEVVTASKILDVGSNETPLEVLRRSVLLARNIPGKNDVLEIDWGQRRITIGDFDQTLSPNEAKLLRFLVRSYPRTVPLAEVHEHLGDVGISTSSLRTLVKRVRKKLGPFSSNLYSHNGVGYGFTVAENVQQIHPRKATHE
jgi:DNA-binding response OmpR family regulator